MTWVQPAFRGDLFFCSNMSPAPTRIWNITFPTTEHAYVYAMLEEPNDYILTLTPQDAKRYGREHRRRELTPAQRLDIMAAILRAKFDQNRQMAVQLIATGDDPLVEVNGWHDNFWGDCRCGRPECAPMGSNYLGRMLMAIRSSL